MEKKYREMVNTRRLYKFEGEFFKQLPYRYMHTQLNKGTLVTIGKVIWHAETGSLQGIPNIRFGKGLHHGTARGDKYYYSWCDRQTIELAPTQRDLMTLIHELVHALGYDYHDAKFVGRYITMLIKYAGLPKKQLILGMQQHKVALPRRYKMLYKKWQHTVTPYKVASRRTRGKKNIP
jgi:hypothetical protein